MQQRQARPRLLNAIISAFHLSDLRQRILITLGILVVFRFIAHVPLPGIDTAALQKLFASNASLGGLLGMLDIFSGGALRNYSIAATGVYPYITSSIVVMLLVPVIPRLQAISEEGEAGRTQIERITLWLTVPLAGLQGYGQLVLLQREGVISNSVGLLIATMVISMIAGTMFCVWLGELINEYGIGNGISIIIFGGIVSGLPEMVGRSFLVGEQQVWGLVFYILIALATIVVIVIFTEAHRRIPVQFSGMVRRGAQMYKQSGSTHIPLQVNSAGMVPLIFASSIIILPGIVASYFANPSGSEPNLANHIINLFSPSATLPLGLFYWGLYFLLTFALTFFYTEVMFQQQDLPSTLQRQGGFVPGIRPGKQTASYLNGVINHITWAGALFLAIVAIIPFVAREVTRIQVIQLSSTSLLIMVGVALDTMKQMEAQLAMRRYEGFIK